MRFIRSLSFLGLMFATLGTIATDANAERRVALVIGNSSYRNVSALTNPANDATAVGAMLRKAGFDVVEQRRDLGVTDMRRVIGDFSERARDADIAVVFYAGHGIEVDGTNYLVPIDAKLQRDFDVEDEAISLDRVLRVVEPAKRLRLVILDACRNNPFLRTMKRTVTNRSIGRGLAAVETSVDTLIAFAAKAGSVADDGDTANSPFTSAVLKHLSSPGLDLRIAFGLVRDEVLKNTRNRQEPYVYGSLGGNIIALVPGADNFGQTNSRPQTPATAPSRPSTSISRPQGKSGQPSATTASLPSDSAQLIFSPWTKFCLKGSEPNAKNVCFTGKDGRVESGTAVVAAVLIEPENDPKKILRVTLPLGMSMQPGTRVIVDQGNPASAPYVICFQNGCMADYEANNDLIGRLKKGQGLVVQGINGSGQPISLVLPLGDFAKAYDGPPTDPQVFEQQQKKLQDELQRRAEDTRKKLEGQAK